MIARLFRRFGQRIAARPTNPLRTLSNASLAPRPPGLPPQ